MSKNLSFQETTNTFFDDFEENQSAVGDCCTTEVPASLVISNSIVKTESTGKHPLD